MDSLQAAPWPVAEPAPAPPPPAAGSAPRMEVAHVLFMDVVGYSKLRMNQQAAAQMELQNLVNASIEVQQAKAERKFICRPAGDGMALLFFRDIVSPVRTALQIHEQMTRSAAAIQSRVGAQLKMRMGIHSGTVLMVEDLNAQIDAAGDGINIAQRVMDCGDADHILLSGKVAENLLTADPWQRYLTDLGDCRVKHGVVLHLYLLHGRLDGAYYGNVAIPKKVEAEQKVMEQQLRRFKGSIFDRKPELKGRLVTFAVLAAIAGGGYYTWTKIPPVKQFVMSAYYRAMHPVPAIIDDGKKAHKTAVKSGSSHSAPSHSRSVQSAGTVDLPRAVKTIVVPDLVGKSLEDAEGSAASDGLRVAKSGNSGYNTQYGEGMIYEQSPPSGASADEGTRIYVRVSKGDPPDPTAAASPSADSGSTDQ